MTGDTQLGLLLAVVGFGMLAWAVPRGFIIALILGATAVLALSVPGPAGLLIVILTLLGVLINWKWRLV